MLDSEDLPPNRAKFGGLVSRVVEGWTEARATVFYQFCMTMTPLLGYIPKRELTVNNDLNGINSHQAAFWRKLLPFWARFGRDMIGMQWLTQPPQGILCRCSGEQTGSVPVAMLIKPKNRTYS